MGGTEPAIVLFTLGSSLARTICIEWWGSVDAEVRRHLCFGHSGKADGRYIYITNVTHYNAHNQIHSIVKVGVLSLWTRMKPNTQTPVLFRFSLTIDILLQHFEALSVPSPIYMTRISDCFTLELLKSQLRRMGFCDRRPSIPPPDHHWPGMNWMFRFTVLSSTYTVGCREERTQATIIGLRSDVNLRCIGGTSTF
jgi:hypothetical protein